MNIKKIVAIVVILAIVGGGLAYFLLKNPMMEGYVLETDEDYVTIISEEGYKKLNGELPTITDSNRLVDEIEYELLTEITYVQIPTINQLIHSEYKKNDKIKVYSNGKILESLPPKINDTILIKK